MGDRYRAAELGGNHRQQHELHMRRRGGVAMGVPVSADQSFGSTDR